MTRPSGTSIRWLPALLVIVAAAAFGPPGPAAATLQNSGPAFPPVPEIAPSLPLSLYSPHYQEGEDVSEVWSYLLQFPDGHVVSLQFMITSIGPGEFTGAMIGYLIAPDGEVVLIKNSRRRGLWTDRSDSNGVDLEIAWHTLGITHPEHRIRLDPPDRAKLDLTARATTDMVRPGRLVLDRNAWYDLTFIAPRLVAEGTIQLPGREPVRLEGGRGIAIHSVANVADHRLATGWLRFDTFDRNRQVSVFELMTSKRYGNRRVGLAMAFRDDRLVGHSYRYGRRLLDPAPDPAKFDYPIAAGLRFGAEDGTRFRGSARLQLVNRNELLSFLNSAVLRFVLKLVSDPVVYQYLAPYEIEFDFDRPEAARIEGEGIFSLYLLNRPPSVY